MKNFGTSWIDEFWPAEGEIWLLVTTGGEFGPESELLFEASTAKTKAPALAIKIKTENKIHEF